MTSDNFVELFKEVSQKMSVYARFNGLRSHLRR